VTDERVGENEALYRTVNEKIEDLNATFGTLTESMTVVCECGHLQCMQQIELGVPGHEMPDVETLVEENARSFGVRKEPGGPAELARARPTRARSSAGGETSTRGSTRAPTRYARSSRTLGA